MPSLADHLDVVAPNVPELLVSREAFGHIRRVGAYLPGAMALRTFGFEIRLGDHAPEADLLLSLGKQQNGPLILAGLAPESELPFPFEQYRAWEGVRRFAEHWAIPNSLLGNHVDDVWLEFDVGRHPSLPPQPSLFFRPTPGESLPDASREEMTGLFMQLVDEAYTRAMGQTVPPGVRKQLDNCVTNLGVRGAVFQAGMMLARGGEGLRLCTRFASSPDLLQYLDDIGWPGPRDELTQLVEELAGLVDQVALDIDVADSLQPGIGFECAFKSHRGPDREPRWHKLLHWLTERGICLSAKQKGLLAYPGYIALGDDGPMSREPLLSTLTDTAEDQSFFVQKLFHVKIVYNPGHPLEAKAYLAVSHYRR